MSRTMIIGLVALIGWASAAIWYFYGNRDMVKARKNRREEAKAEQEKLAVAAGEAAEVERLANLACAAGDRESAAAALAELRPIADRVRQRSLWMATSEGRTALETHIAVASAAERRAMDAVRPAA